MALWRIYKIIPLREVSGTMLGLSGKTKHLLRSKALRVRECLNFYKKTILFCFFNNLLQVIIAESIKNPN